MNKFLKTSHVYLLFTALLMVMACKEPPVPKPRAYFRISLPEKEYQRFDSAFPYTFEIPSYAIVSRDEGSFSEPYWINIDIPEFKARMHISYKEVHNNLNAYIDDAYNMAMKHIPKSTGILEERLQYPEHKVYGIIYDIRGSGAASPMQFFLTDSTQHFLRAALYFNHSPNNDSLKPVINFIKADIEHICSTLEWK